MKDVKGTFGQNVVKNFQHTFGLNEKGGMDKEEFQKYILNSILPLYSDSLDIPGKKVLIKINSGPGHWPVEQSIDGLTLWILYVSLCFKYYINDARNRL